MAPAPQTVRSTASAPRTVLPALNEYHRDDTVYTFAPVDRSGRFTDRGIFDALGWIPGQRLTSATPATGVIILRPDTTGPLLVAARRRVALPAMPRHRCGIEAGGTVFLTALGTCGVLVVRTLAWLDQALRNIDGSGPS